MPTIEVFADVCCPFTHVGLRRFVSRRAELGRDDVRLWVRAWPLELVNGRPLDPHLIAEEVDELRAQVAPDLFAGFDPARFPASSLPGLRMAASAYAESTEAGERVSLALRDALFEQGRDIGDDAVVRDVAAAVGLGLGDAATRDVVLADWHEGQRRGVVGSPYFIVGGSGWFCPSLDIERVDGHLRIAVKRGELDEFLGRCFGP